MQICWPLATPAGTAKQRARASAPAEMLSPPVHIGPYLAADMLRPWFGNLRKPLYAAPSRDIAEAAVHPPTKLLTSLMAVGRPPTL
jgi:hypothetical protein